MPANYIVAIEGSVTNTVNVAMITTDSINFCHDFPADMKQRIVAALQKFAASPKESQ